MKLHLGCGKIFIPGYYHIDVIEFPHVNLVHNIDKLPMVADNTCDVVYSCHVLEHFHKKMIQDVLIEWLRILKPGGVLRISVPDMAALARIYIQTGNLELVLGPIFGRGDYLYNIHYTGFDFEVLKRFLSTAGAINIERYDWRTTEHSNIDDYSQAYYPHMDKKHGELISLNVEALKKGVITAPLAITNICRQGTHAP